MPDKQWKVRERDFLNRFTDPITGEKVGRLPSNGHAQSDGRIPAMQAPYHPAIVITPLVRASVPMRVDNAIRQAVINTIPGNLTIVLLSESKGRTGGKNRVRRLVLMSPDDFGELIGASNRISSKESYIPPEQAPEHGPIDVESKAWRTLPPMLLSDLDTVTASVGSAIPGAIPVIRLTIVANKLTFMLMDAEDLVYLAGGESKRSYANTPATE